MFDQINKYKASFGRLFEAKTLKVMLEIALLTILLSFLGPIKNMIYTEVVNKLSLGITVKLGIIMFASYIVVQVIEECVSYFQIYLNTVLQLKLGQSVSHEINNKLRFLYKGIIIKHNKTEPTYTKTSLFLCEKRRFLWPGLRKEGNLFKLAGPGGLAFFHLTKKEVSKWPMKK